MDLSALVRWVSFTLVMLLIGTTVGLYVVRVSMEDRRPMTVRIQSALDEDIELRLSGAWDNPPPGKLAPEIRFPGAGDGTVALPAGGVLEVPVALEVPGGLWNVITGRVGTGDFAGRVRIAPVSGVEAFAGREFPLTVHVASMWEVWSPLVFWLLGSIALFAVLWWLSRQLLVTPFGELQLVPRSEGGSASAVAGGAAVWYLSDPRLRRFWPFWMRDLICVNTRPLRNLPIVLPDGSRARSFVLQFTIIGPTVYCPRGEIEVLEPGESGKTKRVADCSIVARWRRRQQEQAQQPAGPTQSAPPEPAQSAPPPPGGSLVFAPAQPGQSAAPEETEEDVARYEYLPLDDGAAIVAGDYLLVYRAPSDQSNTIPGGSHGQEI